MQVSILHLTNDVRFLATRRIPAPPLCDAVVVGGGVVIRHATLGDQHVVTSLSR